jgi:hypothetical protein
MATATKTLPKPPPDPIADAEAVIADLEKQRQILLDERAADDVDMSHVAYAAHARHEPEANRQLDEIVERCIRHDQRLREVDAALVTAKSVLQEAQAVKARKAEHTKADEMRAVLKDMRAAGEACDVAVSLLVEAGNRLSSSLDAVHAAGFSHPHHQQLLSMAERATISALMKLPWKRAFPVLPPGQQTSFARFISEWERMLQNAIAAKLGENEEAA